MNAQQIVDKLWNYCNVPRDDGLSYGDYVKQLTFLLLLEMAHERTQMSLLPRLWRICEPRSTNSISWPTAWHRRLMSVRHQLE